MGSTAREGAGRPASAFCLSRAVTCLCGRFVRVKIALFQFNHIISTAPHPAPPLPPPHHQHLLFSLLGPKTETRVIPL